MDTDKKKHTIRDETNQFISDLEKSLNDFEDKGDVDKLKENIEKIIQKFRKN
ncbi:MAG: hypothetical protein GWN01_16710 [Nitrosopumilaceae archaeon]|nr:hypothetical protein [Nitrosopumilaceae archaeon]NIU02475.1 hypothetical protein [Nitrosopumilaceae archaeon]NIU88936.1 hypothetical protein [Nitrosopumilaceae archaeon]NIV67047.1 hypothetical protein [Nitrosopumilaceae archaeon]NIX63076.1 hypothetical protein [Nitrosopumilaceae archaeon]